MQEVTVTVESAHTIHLAMSLEGLVHELIRLNRKLPVKM